MPSSTPSLPSDSGDSSGGSSGEGSSGSKSGQSGSATPEGPGGAQTSEERRQAGEKSLDDSLGDFDKTLKKEQERVARERDARGTAEGEAQSGDEGEQGGGEGAGGGNPRSGDLQSAGAPPKGANNEGDASGENNGVKGASGSGSGSQKVRSGSDDDIVAKRLRKAAEEETDPELKERLWKEYNDYKKATS
jgi:hypothetical protein